MANVLLNAGLYSGKCARNSNRALSEAEVKALYDLEKRN